MLSTSLFRGMCLAGRCLSPALLAYMSEHLGSYVLKHVPEYALKHVPKHMLGQMAHAVPMT